ncbi:MAG: Gfo/Idh/MocA family oxidoreductase [Actinobacteria bacterium]|nr:Gfo/Idh/MocA family oxidoreductase [Actinomycetota bacterium]
MLEATRDSATLEFAAVGGRDRARTERWAADRQIQRAHGSYAELLADPAIEAVYVSLPNALHAEWSLAALEAGRHVLCEKPIGRDPLAVERLAEVAREKGLVFAEAFMYRYHPQTMLALELVAGGRIGRLRNVSATLSFPMAGVGDDPRLDSGMEGGALMDVGCYCVSAARLFAGEPVAAFAEYGYDGAQVDLRVNGLLEFRDGVRAQFDAGMNLPRRDRLELVGEEGTITIQDPWHCRLPVIEVRRPPVRDYGPPSPGEGVESVPIDPEGSAGLTGDLVDAYRLEFEAVSAAIEAGVEPGFSAADAVAQSRVIDALHRSATTGMPVTLAAPEEVQP